MAANWLRRTALAAAAVALLAGPGAAHAQHVEDNDPAERLNRGIFWVNDRIDVFLLEPTARGWRWTLRDRPRIRIDKFLVNLRFPVRFVATALQGNFGDSAEETGRFVVNSTVGLLGFFDPATHWGMELHNEDVGLAFGRWGFGPGPFVMLPLFGPSGVRDGIGLAFDSALLIGPSLINPWLGLGIAVVRVVNTRSFFIEEVREAKRMSLDYYSFVRNAFRQQREALVRGGVDALPTEEPDDDLYEFEDDEE